MLHYEVKDGLGRGEGGKVPNTPKHNIQEQLKCPYNMSGCLESLYHCLFIRNGVENILGTNSNQFV